MIVENVDLEKYNCLTVHAVDKWGLVMRRDAELADHDFIEPKDLINKPIMISRQALAADLPKWMGDDISRVNVVVWRRGQQFTKAGSVFLEEMKRVIEGA